MTKLQQLNNQVHKEKRRLHSVLLKEYTWAFRALDVALLFMILFNFGALFMTNLMVIKEAPDVELYEVNPAAVEREDTDYVLHPESQKIFTGFFFHVVAWFILILTYLFGRWYVYKTTHLIWFASYVVFYFVVLGMDFFNNFGFYVGRLIWG